MASTLGPGYPRGAPKSLNHSVSANPRIPSSQAAGRHASAGHEYVQCILSCYTNLPQLGLLEHSASDTHPHFV